MKKIILSFLILISYSSIAQPKITRTTPSNTVMDSRHGSIYNEYIPIYQDTTTANIAYNLGIDSSFAIIGTRNPKAFWYRSFNPKKWVRLIDENAQGGSITNISVLNDSTLLLCTGDGACDTIPISTTITNITNVSFLNDSTVIVCSVDTTVIPPVDVCDTIVIGRQPTTYIFQNGLRYSASNIVEFGSGSSRNDANGYLNHETWLHTNYAPFHIDGFPIYDYVISIMQQQHFQYSPSIASFMSAGSFYYDNKVPIGFNYTGSISLQPPNSVDTIDGNFGRSSGYYLGTNATGAGSIGFHIADTAAKTVGILFHDYDTTTTSAITLYGINNHPSITNYPSLGDNNGLLYDGRIADFKTNKDLQLYGYVNTRNDGVTNQALYTDAEGNLKLGAVNGGGSITILSDTTINICSNGTQLCDTIIVNDIGNLQTVTILSDTSFSVCGLTGCDTLFISQPIGFPSITGDNGVTANTPTNLQLGGNLIKNTSINTQNTYTFVVANADKKFRVDFTANGTDAGWDLFTRDSTTGFWDRIPKGAVNQVLTMKPTGGIGWQSINQYFTNLGNGDTLAVPVNDSTIGFKSLKAGTNITFTKTDTTITINGSASGLQTADNGLTANTSTNVQLGSATPITGQPLLHDTYLNTDAYTFNIMGGASTVATVQNTGSGVGLYTQSATGFALKTFSNSISAQFQTRTNSTNIIEPIIQVQRRTFNTPANGLGGSIDFYLDAITPITELSNQLISKWTDATDTTRTSQFIITGVNSGTTGDLAYFNGNGMVGIGSSSSSSTRLNIVDNSVGGASVVNVSSTSTAASGGLQKLLNLDLSGANATSGQSTYGIYVSNTHTGTSSSNYGVYVTVSGGAGNNGVYSSSSNGFGVEGISTSGVGILGQSTSNVGVQGNTSSESSYGGVFNSSPSSFNTVVPVLGIKRATTGNSGAGANGIGGSIDFINISDATTNNQKITNQLISKMTDVTNASYTSQFQLTGVTGAATQTWLVVGQSGYLQFRQMTTTERDAITAVEGMVIYNVTTHKLQIHNGTTWNDAF